MSLKMELIIFLLPFGVLLNDIMYADQWESILFELNDSKRYRRTVGSIAGSCLTAATPLLASMNQASCLVALDIVEVFHHFVHFMC